YRCHGQGDTLSGALARRILDLWIASCEGPPAVYANARALTGRSTQDEPVHLPQHRPPCPIAGAVLQPRTETWSGRSTRRLRAIVPAPTQSKSLRRSHSAAPSHGTRPKWP